MKLCIAIIIVASAGFAVAMLACGGNVAADDDDSFNGLWTDEATGLTWEATPPANYLTWADANSYCQNLDLNGQGGWRMPTISDLRTLVRGCAETESGGDCEVTNQCLDSNCQNMACDGCSLNSGPASGCYWPAQLGATCGPFWSSSSESDIAGFEWIIDFSDGYINVDTAAAGEYARCVRP
jgi:hypothetical protein